MSKPFTVTFTGFKSLEHAKEFAAWYDGQGEQDSDFWLEEAGFPTAYVNGPHVIDDNGVTVGIQSKEEF